MNPGSMPGTTQDKWQTHLLPVVWLAHEKMKIKRLRGPFVSALIISSTYILTDNMPTIFSQNFIHVNAFL
jgi:hypothetical protein